jgi:hypothetical protein
MNDKIKCPKCGTNIDVDQIMVQRIRENIENEARGKLEREYADKLKDEIEKAQAEKLAEQSSILDKMKAELVSKTKKIDEFREQELKLHKEKSELEEAKKELEITTQRKLSESQKTIEEKVRRDEEEKNHLKLEEYRKQLDDTKKALGDAQRKAQQGSMQTQGEVMELALEELLKKYFPHDIIEPVPKGINGADIIQKVFTSSGAECGIIAWESKHTKAWTEEWVQKLKDDGQNIHASFLILVSEVLPKNIKNFGLYKGVWVCDFSSILGLTTALRHQLISVNKLISSQTNKDSKKDILYDYLCSPSFSSKIEVIVENFLSMKNNLEKEKIAMTKIWGSRETQINRMIENTAKMYGEIQGIAGSELQSIEMLELESAAGENEPSKVIKKKVENDNQAGLF